MKPEANHRVANSSSVSYEVLDLVQLLEACNIPYVTSPGEADAQCAFMSQHGLVDAVLTEDSDVLVFGGEDVVRGFFTKGFVKHYNGARIKQHCGITAPVLRGLALLLGSDYTEGIPGVGTAAAIDVLAAHLPSSSMDVTDEHVMSALARWRDGVSMPEEETTVLQRGLQLYTDRIRKDLKNPIPAAFPEPEVMNAYVNPPVDRSPQQFEWGPPNWSKVKQLAVSKCWWTPRDIAQRIDPVQRLLSDQQQDRSGNQLLLTKFFEAEKRRRQEKEETVVGASSRLLRLKLVLTSQKESTQSQAKDDHVKEEC